MKFSWINLILSRFLTFSLAASLISCIICISFINNAQTPLLSIHTNQTPPKDVASDTLFQQTPPKDVASETNVLVERIPPTDDAGDTNVLVNPEKSSTPPPRHGLVKRLKVNPNFSSKKNLKKKCNIFEGRWVYDPKESPMYEASQCQFLSDQVSCRRNGRPDDGYEKWRWKARDCEIPRFNGTDMLERLRGKRVILVGDSLNRNQWESLACLLYSSIPSERAYVDVRKGHYKIFKAKDYNCTVEFHASPFIVDYQSQSEKGRILNLDTFPRSVNSWRGADIMVFNTGQWWYSGRWDIMRYKGKRLKKVKTEGALEIGMKTWGSWIDRHVDPSKTTVFFRTISPPHYERRHWCYNQTRPIRDESYVQQFPRPLAEIIQKSISNMKTPVKYLNITKLSEYRKDAHQSVYTTRRGVLLTRKERKKPLKFADCMHWCIPGLPDTWNQLLYISIVLES